MRVSIALALIALVAVVACENQTSQPMAPESAITAKYVMHGSHFTLNIIGVPKDKQNEMDATGDNGIGGRIFVQLVGGEDAATIDTKLLSQISRINKIFLVPGDDFAVLDANATNQRGPDDGATFRMPSDIASATYDAAGNLLGSSTTYRVIARYLGKPGGEAWMSSCATVLLDDGTQDVECSLGTWVVSATRSKGQPITEEVTEKLLFVHDVTVDPDLAADATLACFGLTDTAGEDEAVTIPLVPVFSPCMADYFWNYQNNGLKLMQLRFYPVEPGV